MEREFVIVAFSGGRFLLRPAARTLREVSVLGRIGAGAARRFLGNPGAGSGPRVVFLPAYGEGAALLRIHLIAQALRNIGWRTQVLPPALTLGQRRRCLALIGPDVLVMQGARHPLNRPAFYPGQRIVYDMDDADFHLPHLADPVRNAMPRVAAVMAGSSYIAKWCRGAGAARADVIWTGAPMTEFARPGQADRPPVVAWAQTRPMTYTAEAALMRAVMARVADQRPGVRFRLYDFSAGDDPGFARTFETDRLAVEWREKTLFRDYVRAFDDVAIGLAPLADTPFSRGKGFGKVLTYLDRKVPVVASDVGEYRRFFSPASGRLCTDPDSWAAAILGLLDNADRRASLADAAFADFRRRLTSEAVAQRVDGVLRSVLARAVAA